MKSHLQLILVGLLALLLTAACERGTSDLDQWIAQTKAREGGDIEPIPPIATPEIVTYQAYELRDPFQRRVARADEEVAEAGVEGIRPDPDRPREFLEGFPLDTLRMVGTLELGGIDFALVRDIDNVVHRVSEGDYMGTNHGRVQRVRPDRVELVELYEDARGVWSERRTQIVMAESG